MTESAHGISDKAKLQSIKEEEFELRLQYPSMFFVPNIGQEKAFQFYENYEDSPYVMMFGGGNGVGKSAAMAIMLVGLGFGSKYLNPFMDKYKVFDGYHAILKNRTRQGHIRVICHSDSMKEGGPLYQVIREWFPIGPDPDKPLYKLSKAGKQYYSRIDIFLPGAPIIEVKTHDQEMGAHAGSTIDWVLHDEPPPEDLWEETIGRTRDGGRIMFYLTPLKVSGWMMDKILDPAEDDDDYKITNASLWENCVDIPGTRGHLKRENIDRQIRAWERSNPDEVEARVNGKFTHLEGSVFKIYTPEVHEIHKEDEIPIPPDWPIWCICDPHDAKVAFFTWILQGPNNQAYVIRESPIDDYVQMGTTSLTIEKQVDAAREVEKKFEHQVVRRIMDPNRGAYKYANTNKTVQTEFRDAGMRFDLCKNDDLDFGHKKLQKLLFYNKVKEIDELNVPWLRIWVDRCPNTAKSVRRYGFKPKYVEGASLTSIISPKYKDPVDCLRYYAVEVTPFQSIGQRKGFLHDIYRGRKVIERK